MDLVAYGLPGYTGALAIDYTLTNPTNPATLNNAVTLEGACAWMLPILCSYVARGPSQPSRQPRPRARGSSATPAAASARRAANPPPVLIA